MTMVVMLWVLFRSPSLGYAMSYLTTMLSFQGWQAPAEAAPAWLAAAGVAALFVLHAIEYRLNRRATVLALRRWNTPFGFGLLIGLGLLLILIPSSNANPFIYFRF